MKNNRLIHLPEPKLLFGFGQQMDHPHDGLALFGPYRESRGRSIRYGYIGTPDGLGLIKKLIRRLMQPIALGHERGLKVPFPGFRGVFGCGFEEDPVVSCFLPEDKLQGCLSIKESHQRVHQAVGLYFDGISRSVNTEDITPDVWLVFIPNEVYTHCRPKSTYLRVSGVETPFYITSKQAQSNLETPSLFEEDMIPMEAFEYEPDFHSQLKFRLLAKNQVTQLIRREKIDRILSFRNQMSDPSEQTWANDYAWSLATALYYKVNGTPWKLANLRPGVCYLGLVFKKTAGHDEKTACCAAQMFLDSGDGVVFRGAVGPWYNPERRQFHLTQSAARELVELAVSAYKDDFGKVPEELFIHGRSGFTDEEWEGFSQGSAGVRHVGAVRIKPAGGVRIYADGQLAPMRGLALVSSPSSAILLSKGFVPRLQSYEGKEVPVPIAIDVMRGNSDIEIVLQDIMSLTKLNYNACIFADGFPVTLRFAESIGKILTAGSSPHEALPLPFKFYI